MTKIKGADKWPKENLLALGRAMGKTVTLRDMMERNGKMSEKQYQDALLKLINRLTYGKQK